VTLNNIHKIYFGLSIKEVRSQGGCPVQTFDGQGKRANVRFFGAKNFEFF